MTEPNSLNRALADAVLPLVRADFDSRLEALAKHVADHVRPEPREIVVTSPSGASVNVGRQHERFEALVQAVSAGCSVWLAGPAGSGKTVGAEKCAEALALAFSAVSIGPQTTQAHLMGYMDATGTYRGTEVRQRFEHGGILLLDEIDRGNPGVLTCLNALLANNVCAFPDGMIARHESFRVIAAANTIGMGANRQYVGALQLDAATLDRFVLLEWPYDAEFERDIATELGGATGAQWCARVQALRAAVDELTLRHVISPRATIHGIKLLAAHMPLPAVEEMTVWRGLDAATRERIVEHAKLSDDGEGDNPMPAHADPKLQSGCVCPRCGKSSATLESKIDLGQYVCWRKRGGCGHKWPIDGGA